MQALWKHRLILEIAQADNAELLLRVVLPLDHGARNAKERRSFGVPSEESDGRREGGRWRGDMEVAAHRSRL